MYVLYHPLLSRITFWIKDFIKEWSKKELIHALAEKSDLEVVPYYATKAAELHFRQSSTINK